MKVSNDVVDLPKNEENSGTGFVLTDSVQSLQVV